MSEKDINKKLNTEEDIEEEQEEVIEDDDDEMEKSGDIKGDPIARVQF